MVPCTAELDKAWLIPGTVILVPFSIYWCRGGLALSPFLLDSLPATMPALGLDGKHTRVAVEAGIPVHILVRRRGREKWGQLALDEILVPQGAGYDGIFSIHVGSGGSIGKNIL
jgi:hypothetical protein